MNNHTATRAISNVPGRPISAVVLSKLGALRGLQLEMS